MIIVIIIYNIILIIKKIITFTINNIINMFIMWCLLLWILVTHFLEIKATSVHPLSPQTYGLVGNLPL